MEIPLLSWLLQTIPETLAMASLILALSARRLELKKILLIGLPLAVIIYLVRLLPVTFGVHSIIIITILAMLLNLVTKTKFSRCLLFSIMVLVALVSFEVLFVGLSINITGMTFEQLLEHSIFRAIIGWPHTLMLFILAWFVGKWQQKRLGKGE